MVAAMSEHAVWVVKEPRLCFLLPLLRDYISNPICIHIVRNPLEVARSLQNRNGFGLSAGLALWEIYNQCALAASKHLPRVLVSYESLASQPAKTLAALVDHLVQLSVPKLAMPDKKLIEQFIDPSLYRYRASEKETSDYLTPSQHVLWKRFRDDSVFLEGGSTPLAHVTRQHLLDLESTQLSLNHYRCRTSELRSTLRQHAKTIGSLDKRIQGLEKHKSTLRATLDKRDETVRARERKVHDLTLAVQRRDEAAKAREKRIRDLTLAMQKRDATILHLQKSISWRVTAPLRVTVRGTKGLWRSFRRVLRLTRLAKATRGVGLRRTREDSDPSVVADGIQKSPPLQDPASDTWQGKRHPHPKIAPTLLGTYIVPSIWWTQHSDAAHTIARSGQPIIVINSCDPSSHSNVVTISGADARALALASVSTDVAIEVREDTDVSEVVWFNWQEAALSGSKRLDCSIRLWTTDALRYELRQVTAGEGQP